MAKQFEHVLNRLLMYQRAPGGATAGFKGLKHNDDLCPQLQARLADVLQRYDIQGGLSYDIQGPRDRGTDVLVRIEAEGEAGYYCFQVKSHDELGARDLIQTLRHQLSQSEDAYQPLVRYYIVLFADEMARRDIIRLIEGEFSKKLHVTVVEPSYLHTFVSLPGLKVDAYIRSVIGEEDFVFRQALQDMSDYTPSQAIIVLGLLTQEVTGVGNWMVDDLVTWGFLQEAYALLPDWENAYYFYEDAELDEENLAARVDRGRDALERLRDDLDSLSDYVTMEVTGPLRIDPAEHRFVAAVLFDGWARFGYEAQELVEYALTLFALDGRWGLPLRGG